MSDTEKSPIDGSSLELSSASPTKATFQIDPVLERRAVRKLDLTVVPITTLFYLLSFLDRGNIGNARVAGLQKDLGLTDIQYQKAVTALYVTYIATEIPTNLILRKVGPKILLPTLLTIWGIIVTLQGLVTGYGGLVTCRTLLGVVEGPMLPGITLYLSTFYTRKELSMRVALFFSAASLSGAFSGLLAYGIGNMAGLGGKAGWSWIFILEGLFTVLVGIAGFWIIPASPDTAPFLNDEEREVLRRRLEVDRVSYRVVDHFSWTQVIRSLTSIHVIFIFIMFFCIGTTLYGLALFLPSIVSELGFSPNDTQLLSVGPFASGFVVTIITAYYSDKYHQRAIPTIAISFLAVIGFSMYLGTTNKWVAYGSMYLSVPGIYGAIAPMVAWMANNSEPHYRRATSIGFGFVATNSGGILSTWRFPTKEGPRYTKTMIMDLVFEFVVIIGAVINVLYLNYLNKDKVQRREEILAPYGEGEEASDRAWIELGDKHPDFVYTL